MVARDFPKVKAAGSSPAVSSYPKIFENLLASFFSSEAISNYLLLFIS